MLFFGAGLLVPLGMGDADTGFCCQEEPNKVRLGTDSLTAQRHLWEREPLAYLESCAEPEPSPILT